MPERIVLLTSEYLLKESTFSVVRSPSYDGSPDLYSLKDSDGDVIMDDVDAATLLNLANDLILFLNSAKETKYLG